MENRITSKENRIYKDLVRLQQKKYRDRMARYMIEGPNLIQEAIRTGTAIDAIVISEQALQTYSSFPEIESQVETVYVFTSKLFQQVSQTETSQGILAIVRKEERALDVFLRPGKNYVVLDRLQDPGNLGTIIRTAEGAGYDGILCMKGTADVYAPKVTRAAAGALLRMPIRMVEDVPELLKLAEYAGKSIVVTTPVDAKNYTEVDLHKDLFLVIGNEGNGCSEEMIEKAHIRIKIPMCGKLESLNASVAAGILMYEAMR